MCFLIFDWMYNVNCTFVTNGAASSSKSWCTVLADYHLGGGTTDAQDSTCYIELYGCYIFVYLFVRLCHTIRALIRVRACRYCRHLNFVLIWYHPRLVNQVEFVVLFLCPIGWINHAHMYISLNSVNKQCTPPSVYLAKMS